MAGLPRRGSMDTSQVAQTYLDAWNRRDPTAIVSIFADQGTYRDPGTQQVLRGAAIGAYARELFTAFPDLSFEATDVRPAGDGAVVARWIMRGTNAGPLDRKSTRLNSSHGYISYAVFCLKKKNRLPYYPDSPDYIR